VPITERHCTALEDEISPARRELFCNILSSESGWA